MHVQGCLHKASCFIIFKLKVIIYPGIMVSVYKMSKFITQCVTFVFVCQTSASERISISCRAGTFVGRVKTQLTFNNSYTVNRFLGIPYAEPPIGDLRFKKPVRKATLTKPYDAGKFGASCHALRMEIGDQRKPEQYEIVESEDCLFLNIFAPQLEDTRKKLPVLIFIHGGGFNLGTSTFYSGDILSAFGEVVVVTLNYRLNIWGFLSTGDEASRGNYGLWDQTMAIEWVQGNIAEFGGDLSRVTVSGYSAGAASVIYQALYPKNKGRFNRIIAMSGSPLCPWAFNGNPKQTALKVGRLLGCDSSDSYKIVECIKLKSASDIMSVLDKDELMLQFPMKLVPVVDGQFIKHPPRDLLNERSVYGEKERHLFASYDLLTGVTTHDGLMMITPFVSVHETEDFTIDKDNFIFEEIPRISRTMFSEGTSKPVENVLINEYFPWQDPNNYTAVRDAFIQISTDYVFGIHGARTAHVHSTSNNKNTFFYLFDTLPSQHLVVTPSWSTKPNHCDDLTFLFGFDCDSGFTSWTMPYKGGPPETWETEFSKTYINIMTNFIASGDPNIPNDVTSQVKEMWPVYTPNKQEAFHITRDWKQPLIQRPFARAVNFWYHAVPSVIKEIKSKEAGYCERPEP